jgi:hypothetical protein
MTGVCLSDTVLRGTQVGKDEEHGLRVSGHMALKRRSGPVRQEVTRRGKNPDNEDPHCPDSGRSNVSELQLRYWLDGAVFESRQGIMFRPDRL